MINDKDCFTNVWNSTITYALADQLKLITGQLDFGAKTLVLLCHM